MKRPWHTLIEIIFLVLFLFGPVIVQILGYAQTKTGIILYYAIRLLLFMLAKFLFPLDKSKTKRYTKIDIMIPSLLVLFICGINIVAQIQGILYDPPVYGHAEGAAYIVIVGFSIILIGYSIGMRKHTKQCK